MLTGCRPIFFSLAFSNPRDVYFLEKLLFYPPHFKKYFLPPEVIQYKFLHGQGF